MGSETANIITDQSSLHRYRTEIPNIIDEMDLSVYAFRLYVRLKRVTGDSGKCYYSTRQLAEQCKMSVGSVSNAKQELLEKDLIRVERDGEWDRDNITITDMWPANFAYFAREMKDAPRSPYEQIPEVACSYGEQTEAPPVHHMNKSVHQVNAPVHQVNAPVHVVNTKEEPYKEKPVKKEPKGESAPAAPAKHSYFEPDKFINGRVPEGTGATPAEVFYEIHTLKDDKCVLSSHALATISRAVDDLARWRIVVSEWALSSFKPTNIKGQLDWYREGVPDRKAGSTARASPPSKVESNLAAVHNLFARIREGKENQSE